MFWLRFPREFIRVSPFRVSRGQFVLLRGKLCSSSHVGFHALLCDVTTLDVLDFFRWLVPRRASSGPARVGGRSCESGKCSFEEFQRVQRFKRESAHTARCFKLSGFGHRPQAAGPIRASVRGGAPPARLLLQGTFM